VSAAIERAGAGSRGAKVPRFDYAKYLHGGAAGRRELVHGFGDALREHGGARLQGQGEVRDAAAASAVGAELLAALEDYFGLPAAALQGLMEGGAERVAGGEDAGAAATAAERDSRSLLLLVPEVPAGTRLRHGEAEWSPVSANPGEMLVVPGGGLARLTAGVVPAAAARLPAGTAAWCVCAPAGVELSARPEFCG
jgi:hypothetical protein